MKKKSKNLLVFVAFSLIFTIAYGNGKGSINPATILGFSNISNSIMKLVVTVPAGEDRYSPKAAAALSTDTNIWQSVPHSDNGVNPFITTNLSYSTSEGTNKVIYVQADEDSKFFNVIGE